MIRVLHCLLVAVFVALCCAHLPLTSAAASQRLQDVQRTQALAEARARLQSSSPPSLGVGPGPQLDCPEAGDWSTQYNGTFGIFGLAPLSGCTLLVMLALNFQTPINYLQAIDVRNGSTLWSLQVSDELSIAGSFAPVTVSLDHERAYLRFRNFTKGGGCEFSCDSVSAVAINEKTPRILWNVVLDSASHILQPMGGRGREGEVLAVFSMGDQTWTTINGRTGAVLFRGPVVSSYKLFLLGNPRDGRLVSTFQNNATAYQLQADGSWKTTGQMAWDSKRTVITSDLYLLLDRLPPQPDLLVSQSASQPDEWTGVDVDTGKTVWSVSGQDVFTGKWVTQPGFQAEEPVLSIHPLNTSWAIVTARAYNTQSAVLIQQHTLFDLTTGQLGVMSDLLTFPNVTSFEVDVEWYAVSHRIVSWAIAGSPGNSPVFFVYEPTTLKLVSSGALPAPVDEVETTFSAAGEKGVAAVWRTNSQVVQRTFAPSKTEQEGHRHTRTA